MTFHNAGEITQVAVVERWAWYQAALKDPTKIGTASLPIHPGEYELGYFRVRRKDSQWEPVGIYPDDDGVVTAWRNGKSVADIPALFTWCCRNPISFEAYEKAMAGGGFDDEPARAPGIGDNSGEADPFDAIKIELAGEAEQLAAFMKGEVKTQSDADRIGIWAKRMTEIAKRADGLREVEKAPHLAAWRAVDDKWRDPIAEAKGWAAKAKRHVETFLIAQKREEEARARKAREEAETLRRMAEEATRAATSESDLNERNELLRQAQEAEKASEVRNAQAGRTGAKVSLRTEKRAKIVDFDACLAALKDRPEVIELVQSLANRAVKSGFSLAGVEVETFEKVQ